MTHVEGWECDFCGTLYELETDCLECEATCRFIKVLHFHVPDIVDPSYISPKQRAGLHSARCDFQRIVEHKLAKP